MLNKACCYTFVLKSALKKRCYFTCKTLKYQTKMQMQMDYE